MGPGQAAPEVVTLAVGRYVGGGRWIAKTRDNGDFMYSKEGERWNSYRVASAGVILFLFAVSGTTPSTSWCPTLNTQTSRSRFRATCLILWTIVHWAPRCVAYNSVMSGNFEACNTQLSQKDLRRRDPQPPCLVASTARPMGMCARS